MLRSDLCHYGDAYVAGAISVKGTDNANRKKQLTFKINAQFKSFISKINSHIRRQSKRS